MLSRSTTDTVCVHIDTPKTGTILARDSRSSDEPKLINHYDSSISHNDNTAVLVSQPKMRCTYFTKPDTPLSAESASPGVSAGHP